ncbi:Retrovirus-related Pol polyprotein from transposon 17.6 [Gossypium australe]|uniref:Retrovirus-related Pol polyprotein from transposon 17.6 n=1 Tax=Gossypium australe TaxID=47621 RepID=A0A5B6VKQ8_9ROSI|nr:Retrovirus-related Pol polyprotein from transposon 17.6 [Gossypium australe]
MEALLKEYMAKNDVVIQSQATSLRALENQVGQISSALNSRQQGALPSDTKNSRYQGKEHCKAITFRSGTQLPGVVNDAVVEEDSLDFIDKANSEPQLHINISLVEALEQMPNYVKFVKDILLKKLRLGEFEIVAFIEGPFLATGRILVDLQKGELTMRVNDQQRTFNVFDAMKCVDTSKDCQAIEIMDTAVKEELAEFCYNNSDNKGDLV